VVTLVATFLSATVLPAQIEKRIRKEINLVISSKQDEITIENLKYSLFSGITLENIKVISIINDDTTTFSAKNIEISTPLSILWKNKSKIEINGLSTQSVKVTLPLSFNSMAPKFLKSSSIYNIVKNGSDRFLFNKKFKFKSDSCFVIDSNKTNGLFLPLIIKREKRDGVSLSFFSGEVDSLFRVNYMRLYVKNGELLKPFLLDDKKNKKLREVLISTNSNHQKILNIRDTLSSELLEFNRKIDNVVKFDSLSIKIKRIKLNNNKSIVSDFEFNSSSSDAQIGNSVKLSNLQVNDKDLVDSLSIKWSVLDTKIDIKDIGFTQGGERFDISGSLPLFPDIACSLSIDLKSVSLDKMSNLAVNNSDCISGNFTGNIEFKGVLDTISTWLFNGGAVIKGAEMAQKYLSSFPIKPLTSYDSLKIDTFFISKSEIVAKITTSRNSIDSISEKNGLEFYYNLDSLQISLSEIKNMPLLFENDTLKISASDAIILSLQKDSSGIKFEKIIFDTLTIKTDSALLNYHLEKQSALESFKEVSKVLPSLGDGKRLILRDSNSILLSIGNISFTKNTLESSDSCYLFASDVTYKKSTLLGVELDCQLDSTIKFGEISVAKLSHTYLPLDSSIKFTSLIENRVPFINSSLLKYDKYLKNDVTVSFHKILLLSGGKKSRLKALSFTKNGIDTLVQDYQIVLESSEFENYKPLSNVNLKISRINSNKLRVDKSRFNYDGTCFLIDGTVEPQNSLPCSLSVKVENLKLSQLSQKIFKDGGRVTGAGYGELIFEGDLLDLDSWSGSGSVTFENISIKNIALQKSEIITKFAPQFSQLGFSSIEMNPLILKKGGKVYIKSFSAIGSYLDLTGWGSVDKNGNFYFETEGELSEKSFSKLPNLTKLALYEGDINREGSFVAKLFGTPKEQTLVPERGIYGTVIKSKFKKIGNSFKSIFN
jgi:hypothetical protein